MRKKNRRRANSSTRISPTELESMIEEATVDAYGEAEQAVGFLTMLEEHLHVPFQAETLGVEVTVRRVDLTAPNSTVLNARTDVALTIATLECGDYSIAGERKTADNLGRSIIDGRLFRQVSVLRRRARCPLLLVERLQSLSTPSGVPWHAVRGALVSVAVVFGVPVLNAAGPP